MLIGQGFYMTGMPCMFNGLNESCLLLQPPFIYFPKANGASHNLAVFLF